MFSLVLCVFSLVLCVFSLVLCVFCEQQNPRSQSRESGGKLHITWDNPKELELYIAKLQSSAERLSTENRKLRRWHTDFAEKVCTSCFYLPSGFLYTHWVMVENVFLTVCTACVCVCVRW